MKRYLIVVCMLCFTIFVPNTQPAEHVSKLLKAVPLSQTALQLQFDGEIEAETGEKIENYSITPNITVQFALLDERKNRVLLLTSSLKIGETYQLTLKPTKTEIEFTLPAENEITFGTGNSVTFSGSSQDTSLLVNKDRKTRNNNVGGESTLLCNPEGSIFFVAFDLFDAFEDMGIREPMQVLDVSISLHAQQVNADTAQTIILRRVLLPWREGKGKSERAKENELTYNSALHRNLPWNKPPAQAMLAGIDGDNESDYNGSEDVAHRIDGAFEIREGEKRYTFKSELITDAVRFWVANPDYNYGYLFALRDGKSEIRFSSKEEPDENQRPILTIRYQTQSEANTIQPQ